MTPVPDEQLADKVIPKSALKKIQERADQMKRDGVETFGRDLFEVAVNEYIAQLDRKIKADEEAAANALVIELPEVEDTDGTEIKVPATFDVDTTPVEDAMDTLAASLNQVEAEFFVTKTTSTVRKEQPTHTKMQP